MGPFFDAAHSLRVFRMDSLDKRLSVGLGALIVLLIAVAVTSIQQFTLTRHAVETITERAFPTYRFAAEATQAAVEIRATQIAYATSGDRKELDATTAAIARFNTASDALLKLSDSQLRTLWESVLTYEALLEVKATDMQAAARTGKHAAIVHVIADENMLYAQMSGALDAVSKEEETRIAAAGDGVLATVRIASVTILAITVASLVAGVVVALITIRFVNRPIRAVAKRLRELADGEADLSARIRIDTHDSLGELAAGFNAFVGNLQRIVDDTRGASHTLGAAAERLVESYRGLSSGLTDQNEAIGDAGVAAKQIASSAELVGENHTSLEHAIEHASAATADFVEALQTASRSVSQLSSDVSGTVVAFQQIDRSIGEVATAAREAAGVGAVARENSELGAGAVARLADASRGVATVLGSVSGSVSLLGETSQRIGLIVGDRRRAPLRSPR
jgi:methyl-accepting chemotaxis protein